MSKRIKKTQEVKAASVAEQAVDKKDQSKEIPKDLNKFYHDKFVAWQDAEGIIFNANTVVDHVNPQVAQAILFLEQSLGVKFNVQGVFKKK